MNDPITEARENLEKAVEAHNATLETCDDRCTKLIMGLADAYAMTVVDKAEQVTLNIRGMTLGGIRARIGEGQSPGE